jgi:transposase
MASMHVRHLDELSELIAQIEEELDRRLVPFAEQAARLQTIPGIGTRTAEVVIAEIGVDLSRFPTAPHLGSRAGL